MNSAFLFVSVKSPFQVSFQDPRSLPHRDTSVHASGLKTAFRFEMAISPLLSGFSLSLLGNFSQERLFIVPKGRR